jgi:hypothetical protein
MDDMRRKDRHSHGERHARIQREHCARGDRHGLRLHPECAARGARSGPRTHPERFPRGERQWLAKLTENEVRQIRAKYAAGGVSQGELGHQFGVTQTVVGDILRGQSWRHVAQSDDERRAIQDAKRLWRGERSGNARLTDEKVMSIRRAHLAGASKAHLARKYDVGETTIRNVVTRKTWQHVGAAKGEPHA